MSETSDRYAIVWLDHYTFSVQLNGHPYLSGFEPSMYGMVCSTYGAVTANARPSWTLRSWFNWVVRQLFGE